MGTIAWQTAGITPTRSRGRSRRGNKRNPNAEIFAQQNAELEALLATVDEAFSKVSSEIDFNEPFHYCEIQPRFCHREGQHVYRTKCRAMGCGNWTRNALLIWQDDKDVYLAACDDHLNDAINDFETDEVVDWRPGLPKWGITHRFEQGEAPEVTEVEYHGPGAAITIPSKTPRNEQDYYRYIAWEKE